MAKGCPVVDENGECINPKDKDMKDGMCTAHSYRWRQSKEFGEATRDDAVRFAASLRAPSLLNTALRPHKKRWLKRIAAETEEET